MVAIPCGFKSHSRHHDFDRNIKVVFIYINSKLKTGTWTHSRRRRTQSLPFWRQSGAGAVKSHSLHQQKKQRFGVAFLLLQLSLPSGKWNCWSSEVSAKWCLLRKCFIANLTSFCTVGVKLHCNLLQLHIEQSEILHLYIQHQKRVSFRSLKTHSFFISFYLTSELQFFCWKSLLTDP